MSQFASRLAWPACLAVLVALGLAPASQGQKAEVDVGALSCTLERIQNDPAMATAAGNTRDALCTFRVNSGLEETYLALVEGVTLSTQQVNTIVWVVKATTEVQLTPGILQQNYLVDQAKLADQLAPLLGTTNPHLVLHAMADTKEGSASDPAKPLPTGYVIIGIQLKLKVTPA
jgi:hypothetical protein